MKNRIVCYFSTSNADQPIIYRLVKDYDLVINILKGEINPQKEGYLVIELQGPRDKYDESVKYLKDVGVTVEPLSETVVWHDDLCVQCGACASFCPTQALVMDRETMLVSFDNSQCVVCGMCLECCPTNAIKVHFEIREAI